MRDVRVTYSMRGWVRVEDPNVLGTATLGLLIDRCGRITDLYIDGGTREITAPMLRRLPLARYRAQALARPDLLHAVSYPDDPVGPSFEGVFPDDAVRVAARRGRFKLAPPTLGLTDDFLRDVARAYNDAVGTGDRPNVALAEQTGHPRRSVERWVYLARKAGHLPPTNPGEAR